MKKFGNVGGADFGRKFLKLILGGLHEKRKFERGIWVPI
jgi:hypothetical protein